MTEPVTVVEVGPRDGLQNECAVLSTEVKLAFVRALASAGLSRIEVAAFVRPDRVPAMADAAEVAAVAKDVVPDPSALVPNRRGLDGALAAGLVLSRGFRLSHRRLCPSQLGTVRRWITGHLCRSGHPGQASQPPCSRIRFLCF